MADRYRSAQSPRDSEMPGEFGDERFRKLVQETSKGISSFNQVTRGIAQKMSLFGTPQDSRANHTAVTELTDKGQKLVSRLNKRLQELHKACQSGDKRAMRKAQVSKLSSDFKAQLKSFEDTCKRLVETERHSVDLIRRSSTSFRGQKPAGNEFSNYSEDQIYAQANVVIYDEDGTFVRLS
jgi:syntaxin 12/13